VSEKQEEPKKKKLSEKISQKIGYEESMSKLNRLLDSLVDLVETPKVSEKKVKPEEKQEPTAETELVVRKGRLEKQRKPLTTGSEEES
jgi:hypothetical protein